MYATDLFVTTKSILENLFGKTDFEIEHQEKSEVSWSVDSGITETKINATLSMDESTVQLTIMEDEHLLAHTNIPERKNRAGVNLFLKTFLMSNINGIDI